MKQPSFSKFGRVLISLFICCNLFAHNSGAQSTANANNFSAYNPYSGNYRYGSNPGYYGNNWTAQNVATLAMGSESLNVKGVGIKSLRIPLYDDFLMTYGINAELPKFQYYTSLGGGDFTAFVGSPHYSHREPTTFPGSPEQAKTFKGLYEPVWLDASQTQINPNNTYAKYLYDVVKIYGPYVKFWEIINEPDYTYSGAGWLGDANPPTPGSWFDHQPTPEELVNLRTPIQYYIRTLRVSWEVIKKLSPDSYVCTGGLGYRSFLDALLRNSDNPADGSVTAAYPLKGGAYFDVLSYHIYPMHYSKIWSNAIGGFQYFRHSDAAAKALTDIKDNLDNLLASYGYNGISYPKKQFICTETGLSRIMVNDLWGSNEGQKNYMIKGQIAFQKAGVKQSYWFQLGDQTNINEQFDQMGMYKYFGGNIPYNATAADQGIALKTTSDLLFGKNYDAAKTSLLSLPAGVEGAAFRGADGTYVYALWAKTTTDLSESANAVYSFPSLAVVNNSLIRKEWNFSQTNATTTVSKTNLNLSGTPSFFSEAPVVTNQLPIANAGSNQTITLPTNSVNLNGSGTDADGYIVGYSWTKISGPTEGNFTSTNTAVTIFSGMVTGTYTFRITVTDNSGAKATSDVIVTVNATSATSSTSNKIEAENYSSMNGVQTENTWDAGGGKNVGWIDQADWMDYSYNAPFTGNYTVKLRVATPNSGGQLQIKKQDGTVLATVNVPNTGAYQNWQTITSTINLSQGLQTLRVQSSASPLWNINWLEIIPGSEVSSIPPTSTKIEAENYSSMNGVQTENTWDAGGGKNVGWIDQGDWMDYLYNAPINASYTVNLRVATPNNGGQLQIKKQDGTVLTTVNVPNTGAYQNWQTITTTINLSQGLQTLRVQSSASPLWNINWLEIIPGSEVSSIPPTSTKIEAENYSTMNGVQTEITWDAGGGKNVGWIDQGDWMDYSYNAPVSGSYTVNLRVASPNYGGQLQIKKQDGTVLATVNVPNTGAYQNWQTITTTINLSQGLQTLRVQSSASPLWNINWLEIMPGLLSTRITSTQLEEEEISMNSFEIFPNPVKDRFIIKLNNKFSGNVNVQIINLLGSLQKQLSFIKQNPGYSQFIFSTGDLSAGSYIIKLTMKEWSGSKQIIKQ